MWRKLCSGMQSWRVNSQIQWRPWGDRLTLPEASRELLEEIRTRRDLCNEVANEIEQYIKNAAAVDGATVRAARTARSLGGESNPPLRLKLRLRLPFGISAPTLHSLRR
jgi:hypothetical protein